MAGIEKICEFSGEYPGWVMRSYKLNQLQIMPKYRKEFRGAEAILYVAFDEVIEMGKYGYSTHYPDHYTWFGFKDVEEYQRYLREVRKVRLLKTYDFCLVVTDPKLLGKVKGQYFNYTHDLKTVYRKLKRLLRVRKLKVVFVSGRLYDQMKLSDKSVLKEKYV